jgi:hypothetical protein
LSKLTIIVVIPKLNVFLTNKSLSLKRTPYKKFNCNYFLENRNRRWKTMGYIAGDNFLELFFVET